MDLQEGFWSRIDSTIQEGEKLGVIGYVLLSVFTDCGGQRLYCKGSLWEECPGF